jgi:hypothetical protein
VAKPLFERIQAALAPSARAVDVAALIEEVREESRLAKAEQAKQHAIAVSVTSDDVTADAAADAEAKAQRRIVRLAGQLDQLNARRAEMEEAERQREREAARKAALADRDVLVADLQRDWPRIEAEILVYLWRIRQMDLRLAGMNESAEAMARNVPSNFYMAGGPIMRLTEMRLPRFAGEVPEVLAGAWPPTRQVADRAAIDPGFVASLVDEAQAKRDALVASADPQPRVSIDIGHLAKKIEERSASDRRLRA